MYYFEFEIVLKLHSLKIIGGERLFLENTANVFQIRNSTKIVFPKNHRSERLFLENTVSVFRIRNST
jgi:hypothetical protein